MGIPGLWEVLGKGEEFAIADYAAAHWEQHKRPLRIAVDEACWRFGNLNDDQVIRIREGEPAANPIESTILYRILKLWALNIQLLFITDGLKKPGKKRWGKKAGGGRGGSKVDKACIKMLHQMFDRLHVPYHAAPGEAEAECARLQQLGVTDAVWSDDGDCLMFGCTTLIKAHRNAAGKKEWDRIQVYRAEEVLPKFDLDTDSLVMFAILAGGDYDDKGLVGCGPQKAKNLVQRSFGLAQMLRGSETNHDFITWRHQLAITIREMDYFIDVPTDFPCLKVLDGYRAPAISSDERCRNLRGLHIREGGWEWWESQMDLTKLRVVLRSHYNFQTRKFLKYLAPVFLARALTRNVTPARREENLSHGVVLRRTMNRKGKAGEDLGQPAEINIKFNAALLVDIDLSVRPPEEDWSYTVKNDGKPYDPSKPLDGEMLSCFLEHGLPEGALDKIAITPKKKGKKSKGTDVPNENNQNQFTPIASQQSASPATAQKTKTYSQSGTTNVEGSQSGPEALQSKAAKKRRTPSEHTVYSTQPAKSSKKSKKSQRTPSPSPPPATFRRLEIPSLVNKNVLPTTSEPAVSDRLVIELDDDSESDVDVIGIFSPAHSDRSLNLTKHKLQDTPGSSYHSVPESSQATTANARRPISALSSPSVPPKNPHDIASASRAYAAHLGARVQSAVQLQARSPSPVEPSDLDVTPSAAMLRQQRERGLLSKLTRPLCYSPNEATNRIASPSLSTASKPRYEVIDLT